jgi:hypothetical protein
LATVTITAYLPKATSSLIDLWESGTISSVQVPALEHIFESRGEAYALREELRDRAIEEVRAAKRRSDCDGSVLFHYTGPFAALAIFASREMWATVAIADPYGFYHPEGAYATDVTPWEPGWTQRSLLNHFYFDAEVRAAKDSSYFVAICNDVEPLFEPTSYPREWVKPGGGAINPIAIGRNPMP